MIPRVQIDPRKDIHTYARATGHPFYDENLPILEDLFKRSVMTHRGKYPSLIMQAGLLQAILLSDQARKKYERNKDLYRKAIRGLVKGASPVERIKEAQNRLEDMDAGQIAARWFGERLRVIGDGIAWRVLNYDRAALRLLAEHPPLSTPQIDVGLLTEVEELMRIAGEERDPPLLNAITNFLRVGDITIYDPESGSIKLVEVKSGAKRDSRSYRQGEHRSAVQEGLDSGIHSMGGVQIRKIMAARPLKTHVLSVEQAMREAEHHLGASRKFGDYLTVGVLATSRVLASVPEEKWSEIWGPVLERVYSVQKGPSDVLLGQIDNLFAISHFSPNLAPYTVFPIEPRLRFALMTGDLWVISLLNISGLARWLEKRGWKAKVLEPTSRTPDNDEFPYVGALQVGRKGVSVEFGVDSLMVAAMEFWMPEAIEVTVGEILKTVPPSSPEEPSIHNQVNFPNVGKYAWD